MIEVLLVLSRPVLGLPDIIELENLISELTATSAVGLAEIQQECARRGLMLFLLPGDIVALAFYQEEE